MLFHLFGAEKLRIQRLLIAEPVQEGVPIGTTPDAVQAPEKCILAYDYDSWELVASMVPINCQRLRRAETPQTLANEEVRAP